MARRVFLALLCAVVLYAAPALSPSKIDRIEELITAEMARQSIPGLSISVATDGALKWSAGFGMADLENFVPAKSSSVYRLASISKPITAVAAMQLVEQHKMDLDAPVETYLPQFPHKPWPIRIRHLLTHQSGIRHYNEYETDNREWRHYYSTAQCLRRFHDDPLLFEPGTKRMYTTYGYVLLGAAVEAVSGTSLIEQFRERIFRPAGMRTIRDDNTFALIPNRVRGYRRSKHGQILNCDFTDTSYKIAGGGLISNADDLVKFALAFDSGMLVKKSTAAQMLVRQKLANGEVTASGLGWAVTNVKGQQWWGHSGGQQGTTTDLIFLPGAGTAIAVMMNLEGAQRFTVKIAQILMEPE